MLTGDQSTQIIEMQYLIPRSLFAGTAPKASFSAPASVPAGVKIVYPISETLMGFSSSEMPGYHPALLMSWIPDESR